MKADPYAAWAPSYPPLPHNPLMQVEQEAVVSLLPPLDGLTAIDAGAGTGRYARLLIDGGAARVVAIDRSSAMLERASHSGVHRVRADARAMPIAADLADLVIAGLMLPDVADLAPVVAEWRRVLKAGGTLVCSTLHPRGAQEGWKRTFEAIDGTRLLPAHWHTHADIRAACEVVGLTVDAVLEPLLPSIRPGPGRPFSRPLPDGPAVALVIRARRLAR